MFFEVLIGILTLWKAVQHAYVLSNAAAAPMLHIMFRDGLFWFTAVVGLRVWNALIWMFLPQSMVYLGKMNLYGMLNNDYLIQFSRRYIHSLGPSLDFCVQVLLEHSQCCFHWRRCVLDTNR